MTWPEDRRVAVFLLAGSRLLREALTKILNKKTDIAVVGCDAYSSAAIEQIRSAAPDVLLLDSFTTAGLPVEFIREVLAGTPALKIIMIGMDEDEHCFLQAVREGAMGYVLKDAAASEVVTAVRSVASGEAVCPARLCRALFVYVARHSKQMPSLQVRFTLGLTSREQQLVPLISRGFTNKEIASQLQLSEQTVRNHVHRMLRKVGANNRMAVVQLCRDQGLAI
jgi:DNA-binding NarL/FixJ family response regulator